MRESPVGRRNSKLTGPEEGVVCLSCEAGEARACRTQSPDFTPVIRKRLLEYHCDLGGTHSPLWALVLFVSWEKETQGSLRCMDI